MSESFDLAARRKLTDEYADAIIERVGANSSEAESIRKLAHIVTHGSRMMDLTFRRDGREYRFEADWVARLFRAPPKSPEVQS